MTNADLDHVAGLLALREGNPLVIYATKAIRRSLTRGLGLDRVLQAFCGAVWRVPSTKAFLPLKPRSGLRCRAVTLQGGPPRFDRKRSNGCHSVAYQFMDDRTGGRLLVAPDVAAVNDELQKALEDSHAVLFDGTFWSSSELARVKPGAPGAAQMGHILVRDSLKILSKLSVRYRIYIHINNTNSILARRSRERSAVEAAGIVVGYDGLEFEL